MRLAVTGGLGFIGSNFLRLILRERPDISVVNFDAMTYAANVENCRDFEGDARYRFVHGNICDERAVGAVVESGVDAIVNFAAETHVDRSILEPETFLRTDVLGTHVLLEAVRKYGVKRFVQVSTDEVYGDVQTGESSEGDALRPRSPYSASKAGGDLQVLAYFSTYGTPVAITRGSNTYGPYQFPEKLIPLFVTNLIDDQPVPIYGDGGQIRDWLHVDDHARGILRVLEDGVPGNVYNIGGGNARTNLEITQRLLAAFGKSPETHVKHVSDRPGHDRRYAVNCDKIGTLGWVPEVPFERGLSDAIEWYRTNESWWRPLRRGAFNDFYERHYANR